MLAIDLCAGSGWAVACNWLGISELGIEIMPEAIATRDALGSYTQNVSIADLPDNFCAQAPLQLAGPPCQTFSAAGKGEGRKALDEVLSRIRWFADTGNLIRGGAGDPRTWLVLEPLRLAIGGMPMFIVWEQVPAVLPVWEACADVLTTAGYSTWIGLLHAEQYGVPQTRKRAFLIARRDGVRVAPPVPTHSRYHNRDPKRLDPGVLPWVSMAEALGWTERTMRSNYGTGGDSAARGLRDMEQPAPTVTSKIDRNHWVYRNGNQANAEQRSLDHRPAEAAPSFTIRAQGSGSHPSGTEWEYRSSTMPNATVRHGGEPAPTVAFGNDAASVQIAGKRVSVQEAATLQTFPAGHPFQGTSGKQYLQVGNAVPPLLGWHILRMFTETES